MNLSTFNIYATLADGRCALFNTMTGALALLDEHVTAKVKEGILPDMDLLAKHGFTIADPNEQHQMMERIFIQQRDSCDTLTLCILPTYTCNLACVYCYEPQNIDAPSTMPDEVMEAICNFVQTVHKRDNFTHLEILWYGGEPTLCREVIATLSARLIAYCDAYDIHYEAEMISNSTLIDKEYAAFLHDECKLSFVMPTIDGCRERHEHRRPRKDGSGSYDAVLAGIQAFKEAGVEVMISCNMEGTMFSDYPQVQKLAHELGTRVSPCSLRDYRGIFDTGAFCSPEFDLLDRETHAKRAHDVFAQTPYSSEVVRNLLKPRKFGCRGYKENYFVIDCLGDVYKCDGYVGQKDQVIFSLFDDIAFDSLKTAPANPLNNAECHNCSILPICKGYCYWARDVFGQMCHVYRYTIEDYLRDYVKSLSVEGAKPIECESGVSLMVASTSYEQVMNTLEPIPYNYMGAYSYE